MTEFCRLINFFFFNGRHTHNAKYTCKDKSVIDYFLCSPSWFDWSNDLCVLEFNLGEISSASNFSHSVRLWNPGKSNCFQEHFNIDRILKNETKYGLNEKAMV